MAEAKMILVIDDEEIVHSSIKRILARIGHEVESAMTAADGLEMLAKKNYDAVITDLMMPEMNGIEMLHAMKEQQITVPTIMITGYPTIKTAIQSLRLGAVDYIPKPFTRQEILSPLNRALRRSSEPAKPSGRGAGASTPRVDDCYYLPEHSWAHYNEDGTVDVGVESNYLASIAEVTLIELPLENDLVEQGYTGIRLQADGEQHGVFMPLSGRVVQINDKVVADPKSLDAKTWVVKIIPAQLQEELNSLSRRQRC